MAKEAWQLVEDLARMIAVQPANYRTRSGAMNGIVGEIAWTFVDEVTREIAKAMRPRRGEVKGGKPKTIVPSG